MSIDSTLERIAAALEKIADRTALLPGAADFAEVNEAAAALAELTAPPVDLPPPPYAEVSNAVLGHAERHGLESAKAILAKYKAKSAKELEEKDYRAVIAACSP